MTLNHFHASKLQVLSKGGHAAESPGPKLVSVSFSYLQNKFLCAFMSLTAFILIEREFDHIFGICFKMAWITPSKCFFLFSEQAASCGQLRDRHLTIRSIRLGQMNPKQKCKYTQCAWTHIPCVVVLYWCQMTSVWAMPWGTAGCMSAFHQETGQEGGRRGAGCCQAFIPVWYGKVAAEATETKSWHTLGSQCVEIIHVPAIKQM